MNVLAFPNNKGHHPGSPLLSVECSAHLTFFLFSFAHSHKDVKLLRKFHIPRRLSFFAILDDERNLITLLGIVIRHARDVDENICFSIFRSDEAKAFFGVEELNSAGLHTLMY